jgi:hypothetical protein
MKEIELRQIMKQSGLAVIGDSITAGEKTANMLKTLFIIIPPKSISDRTTIRNVVKFYSEQAKSKGQQPDSVFKILVDFALEASGPFSRIPIAVFISILKKELGYLKDD